MTGVQTCALPILALDILETVKPDIMLFDYAMPVMNGAELARLARQTRAA